MSNNDERKQQILRAAAEMFIRHGYDKTSMGDVANHAGVSRGTVYLYFAGKEELFEALFYGEMLQYAQTWLEQIEADPRGGTIGGIYQAVLHAINAHPFMTALMRQDRHILGSYLRKPDNLLASMQSPAIGVGLLQALQAAGTVRKDVDLSVMAYVMDVIGYGLINVPDRKNPADAPSFTLVVETIRDMMDHLLTPVDGGDSEAGKAVIRQLAAAARQQVEQMRRVKEK